MTKTRTQGFTLAELLSAMVILGVIATFTIPKVLNAVSTSQHNSIAKEMVATASEAYMAYRLNNSIQSTTGIVDITPYLNYVRVDTSTQVDEIYGVSGHPVCDGSTTHCLKLHSGAMFYYVPSNAYFNGTTSGHAMPFMIDPDGRMTDGTLTNSGRAVQFWIYTNGKVRTRGTVDALTKFGPNWTVSPQPSRDPPWFSW